MIVHNNDSPTHYLFSTKVIIQLLEVTYERLIRNFHHAREIIGIKELKYGKSSCGESTTILLCSDELNGLILKNYQKS